MDEMIAIVRPAWAWIGAFTGLFLLGGAFAALLFYVVVYQPLRAERDELKRATDPDPPRFAAPNVPAVWPRDEEHTKTLVSP